jgi:putative salt-induced outer membrane protein YdiY
MLSSDEFKIRLGTTYFYEHESYNVPVNSMHGSSLYANRLSTYLTFEYVIKEEVKLVVINYYQPQIGNWQDYRIISDNSLIVSLSSDVDLKVGFNLRYDSRPAETIKNTDTITRFGFSFKF